jgi:hypothetical protein
VIKFALNFVARLLSNAFDDWRKRQALKELGKAEQRLDNMVAAAKSRVESDDTFRKVEGGNEDLRDDL